MSHTILDTPPASSPDLGVALDTVRSADIDADAERHRAHLLAFCEEHPDALCRSYAPGHLTGSAAVLEAGTGQLAFLLHAKVRRWLQPGGHADGEANLARVALGEATEETGLRGLRVVVPAVDVDVHVFEAEGEQTHLHFDLRFLVVAPEGAELVGNHESEELRWFEQTELDSLALDSGTHRLIGRARTVAAGLGLVRGSI